jgi:hypothetical protein
MSEFLLESLLQSSQEIAFQDPPGQLSTPMQRASTSFIPALFHFLHFQAKALRLQPLGLNTPFYQPFHTMIFFRAHIKPVNFVLLASALAPPTQPLPVPFPN